MRGKNYNPNSFPMKYGQDTAAEGVEGAHLLEAYERGDIQVDSDGEVWFDGAKEDKDSDEEEDSDEDGENAPELVDLEELGMESGSGSSSESDCDDVEADSSKASNKVRVAFGDEGEEESSEEEEEERLDEADVAKMKVAELRAELQERGAPTTGLKAALVERLVELLRAEVAEKAQMTRDESGDDEDDDAEEEEEYGDDSGDEGGWENVEESEDDNEDDDGGVETQEPSVPPQRPKDRIDHTRILSNEDFAMLERLKAAQKEREMNPKFRSKRKRDDAFFDAEEELPGTASYSVTPSMIAPEVKTSKSDKIARLTRILEGRKENKFEHEGHAGGLTNKEKLRKKNYVMVRKGKASVTHKSRKSNSDQRWTKEQQKLHTQQGRDRRKRRRT